MYHSNQRLALPDAMAAFGVLPDPALALFAACAPLLMGVVMEGLGFRRRALYSMRMQQTKYNQNEYSKRKTTDISYET